MATYHPVTTEAKNSRYQIQQLIKALRKIGIQTIFTYPNADIGSNAIIGELIKLKKVPGFFIIMTG